MKLTRVRTAMTAGVLAVAGTAAAVALTVTPASAGSTSAPKVVLVNGCTGAGQVRPGRYEPGCMPSSEYFAGLKWVSWRSVAYGSGTLKVNSCNPTCAQGKYINYPILTVLWRAEARPGHHGQHYFSRLTFIFTGKRPRGAAAQTMVLAASQP